VANEESLRVLVVEDDADTQANVADILELDGYAAVMASTFAEALNRTDWVHIAAILMDRLLPDGNAEEMLPRFRRVAPSTPIVVVTGFPDVQGAIDALRAGAHDYLLKPVNPDALRASLRRIAEQKRTEQALREADERLRAIVQTSGDAIIGRTLDGIIETWNEGAERLYGYTSDEVIGQSVSLIVSPDRAAEFEALNARVARGERIKPFETVRIHKSGRPIAVSLSMSPIRDASGNVIGAATIARDISERKGLQAEVLRVAEEEQRRIGHELHDSVQQELTGLGLLAQIIFEELAGGSIPDVRQAERVAKGIAETNRKVRFLSRGLIPVEVDAQGLMSALTELANRTEYLAGLRSRFTCKEQIALADSLTATQLYRIAQEAVNNVVKHAQASALWIDLEGHGDGLTLRVADNGIGISPQDADRQGTGLHIMAYRAGLIGGTVQVARNEPAGTAVTCHVRLTHEHTAAIPGYAQVRQAD
jgi:PAS domain S-box-containing protein